MPKCDSLQMHAMKTEVLIRLFTIHLPLLFWSYSCSQIHSPIFFINYKVKFIRPGFTLFYIINEGLQQDCDNNNDIKQYRQRLKQTEDKLIKSLLNEKSRIRDLPHDLSSPSI